MDPTLSPGEAVVAYLRARAPGLPAAPFDPRAVTARARRALRRRNRLRNSAVSVAGAGLAYLMLALAGPLPVPGVGPVSLPGSNTLRAVIADFVPGAPPGPRRWPSDVDRLEKEVLPVIEELRVFYYVPESDTCRILEYSRGQFGDPGCSDLMALDPEARADFDRVTAAVKRSGVAVERIFRNGGICVQVPDSSWQYNYQYVYKPGPDMPPETRWPGEQWTHIRGDWWFHRAHDD
ncbi:hypothetical protein [Dactylosporangium sp. NPDC049140]|uniref:hypothetical protein n=1 Tax=Dactylosporangium sp. NPDC049140 TaxID=3155647 RepID=UPI0033E8C255